MQPAPPFSLVDYHFTRMVFLANDKHNPNGNRFGTRVTLDMSCDDVSENHNAVAMSVSISVDVNGSDNCPYIFDVGAVGLFTVSTPDLKKDRGILAAFANFLIGAIRQAITTNSGFFIWGRFNLGFMSIDPQQIKLPENKPQRSKAAATAKKRKIAK